MTAYNPYARHVPLPTQVARQHGLAAQITAAIAAYADDYPDTAPQTVVNALSDALTDATDALDEMTCRAEAVQ